MTIGQIAGLIAAVAFVVLVCFVGVFLHRLAKTLTATEESLRSLTNDAHTLSESMDKVVNNTNELLDDINDKSAQLDPAVKAVADVSESVSDVNAAAHRLADKLSERQRSVSAVEKVAGSAGKMVLLNLASKLLRRNERKRN
ncbi:DUF948 domain-containing protein [Limosilactobacillus difficilis]|uniref:DUF948 domain-containing protein n=1 Tax=Limosilactobacillus difficilis TaxID=2991838 RepID=UPI0024BA09E4|nr:DUF948 domain-containing protein [Limosilactobacillus difficilis]